PPEAMWRPPTPESLNWGPARRCNSAMSDAPSRSPDTSPATIKTWSGMPAASLPLSEEAAAGMGAVLPLHRPQIFLPDQPLQPRFVVLPAALRRRQPQFLQDLRPRRS